MNTKTKLAAALVTSVVALAGLALSQCQATGHPVTRGALGVPLGSGEMLRQAAVVGPLEVETVASADWAVARSQILNLESPAARAAGLTDGDEPIQVYFHVIRHPTRGTFLVDTGVERALGEHPEQAAFRGFIASYMHMDRLVVKAALGDWLAAHGGRVDGLFFTHLHLDHVTGLADVPLETPLYAGPGEAHHGTFLNAFSRAGLDRAFHGREPLREWAFAPDPDGRFDGVLDVFGDGSLFALSLPGHTVGSTAYLARTSRGPVLLTGDTASTVWGWEHSVEPGAFTADHPRDAEAMKRLHALADQLPGLELRLGHQAWRR